MDLDCNYRPANDFFCDCPRKFSDPNASWGWDSHNERYFYGYTGYFISTYNRTLKLDLPLCLRLVDAKRHDSISAVVALAEFRDLYPNLIRVNNRILHNYGLEKSKTRGKKRISFFAAIAGFNIHLDAQLVVSISGIGNKIHTALCNSIVTNCLTTSQSPAYIASQTLL